MSSSLNLKAWLRHVLLLKKHRRGEIWILVGAPGTGKTSTAEGMLTELKEAGLSVCRGLPERNKDVWFLDDGGKYFSKRFWSTALGKAISRFLQIIRTLFTLTIITVPRLDDLDISIRESEIVEIIQVIKPGLCIWRSPITVQPIFQDESWREPYLDELKETMQKMES